MTPLQRQLIHVPFAGGMHQKTDQRWLELGNAANVTNGIWLKQNQIQKRPGISPFSKVDINATFVNNLTVGVKAYAYKSEVGIIDGQYIRSYSPTLDRWSQRDEVSVCVATREGVAQTSKDVFDSDLVEVAGYRVRVWNDALNGSTPNGFYSVSDVASGAVVLSGDLDISNSTGLPKLIGIGTRALVIYQNGANILYKTLDLTAAGLVAGWSVVGTLTNLCTGTFDVTRITNNANLWALVFEKGAGPNHIHLATYNSNPTIQSQIDMAGEINTTFQSFAMRGDSTDGRLWIVYGHGTNGVKCAVHNPVGLAQLTAPFTVEAPGSTFYRTVGIERLASGFACIITAGAQANPFGDAFRWGVFSNIGGISVTQNTAYGQWPLSKPFAVASQDSTYGVRVYMMVANSQGALTTSPQITQYLVELNCRTDYAGSAWVNPVATIAPRFSFQPAGLGASGYMRSGNTLSSVNNFGNTTASSYVTTGTVSDSLSVLSSGTPYVGRNGVIDVTFDFAHPGRYTTAELGDSLYMSGGIPSVYDGNVAVELSTLMAIDYGAISATTSVAGGSLQASQTYSYVFVAEWYDAKGQRMQGQPSIPVTATTTGTNKKVLIVAPQLPLTAKADVFIRQDSNNFTIVPYRTAYVGGAMSTVFYRLIGTTSGAVNTGVQPNNLSFTFTDDGTLNFADANVINNETLYTTGGILEADTPPSFTTLCAHKNRIYGVGDDRRTVYFSTEYVAGQTVRFNDSLVFSVADIGPLVACWSMDDKLFFASKTKIVYFAGSGPNELGQNSDLSGPYKIASDVGCVDPRSVVVTQSGTFFQSSIGIALLDRSLSISSNIGDDVEDVLAANPFVTSAFQHPSRPEVWFTLATSSGAGITTGACVSYNYRFGAWSQHLYYDSDQSRNSAGFVSSVASNGSVQFLTPFGQMFAENTNLTAASSYLDPLGTWITTSVTTAWIKPAGVQGFARMWNALLAVEWNEGADLTLFVSTDYSTTFTQSQYYAATATAVPAGRVSQMELRLLQQKGEAYQFKITDGTPTGVAVSTGRGVFFTGLTVEVGVKDRPYRLPAARRA